MLEQKILYRKELAIEIAKTNRDLFINGETLTKLLPFSFIAN